MIIGPSPKFHGIRDILRTLLDKYRSVGEPESGSTKSIGTTHISPYTPHDPQPAD
jgi:hypothetical protein